MSKSCLYFLFAVVGIDMWRLATVVLTSFWLAVVDIESYVACARAVSPNFVFAVVEIEM